jgi:hypothetical protein
MATAIASATWAPFVFGADQQQPNQGVTVIAPNSGIAGGNININPPAYNTSKDCSEDYLRIKSDDSIGAMIIGKNHSTDGYARRFRITISNPTQNCSAVMPLLGVEVVDVIPYEEGPPEGLMQSYQHVVRISPHDLHRIVKVEDTDKFAYAPNESIEHVIDVFTKKWGVTYVLRVVAQWRDISHNDEKRLKSWVLLAPFSG